MEMDVSGIGERKHLSGGKIFGIIALVLVLLFVIVYAVPLVFVLLGSKTEINGEPKVMVIFGCEVENGEVSDTLRDRLDVAIDYLVEHPDVTVIVTGGKGTDSVPSEAESMRKYLTQSGITNSILIEDRSTTTSENVDYTLDLINEQSVNTSNGVLLVSSGFHLTRIKMLWEQAGGTSDVSVIAAPVSSVWDKIVNHLREPFVLIGDFFSTLISGLLAK